MCKVSEERQEDTGCPAQVRAEMEGKEATSVSKTVEKDGRVLCAFNCRR